MNDIDNTNKIDYNTYTVVSGSGPQVSSAILLTPTKTDVYPEPQYKYNEGQIISDFKKYIDSTYSQHYKTTDQNIECFDAWIALSDATPTFRNTALKYLWRYGKKNGNNRADLLKTLHYTLMCLHNDHYKENK